MCFVLLEEQKSPENIHLKIVLDDLVIAERFFTAYDKRPEM